MKACLFSKDIETPSGIEQRKLDMQSMAPDEIEALQERDKGLYLDLTLALKERKAELSKAPPVVTRN